MSTWTEAMDKHKVGRMMVIDGKMCVKMWNTYAPLQELLQDKAKLHVVAWMGRPGVVDFVKRLEFEHYPPLSAKNDLFEAAIVNWPDDEPMMRWYVLSFPREDRPQVEALAKECGLRFADGIPTLLQGDALEPMFFPMRGDNVWSLESIPESADEQARRRGQGWG